MRRTACALVLFGIVPFAALAEERPDKNGFDLFHPTPESLMREMETDRPDKTESPITVDAGHFQLEMDFATYTTDRSSHEKVTGWGIAPVNLKVGVLNNVDLQLVVETYNIEKTTDRDTGRTMRAEGFGDIALRIKINFWGDDDGSTAFAAMPFLKVPTASHDLGNGAVEGGVILPLLFRLPLDNELAMQLEVDHARDMNGGGYHQEIVNAVTFSHDFTKRLAAYVELFSNVSNERHAGWIATFDCGLTYRLSPNVQLDTGVNVGLTDAADDLNPFVGLSVRY
ncbi:MAG TPA: transporter [Chthoniobacterales bacterium]|nr:transporter [Chthoniobacterales bacterium]